MFVFTMNSISAKMNIIIHISGVTNLKIHSNLSTLMGKKRLLIKDVHEYTGLSRKTISNLYNDRVTRVDFETIEKLCALLECEIGELLVRE